MLDYVDLIKKYMEYVYEQEGTDFLGHAYPSAAPWFSKEEYAELQRISRSV